MYPPPAHRARSLRGVAGAVVRLAKQLAAYRQLTFHSQKNSDMNAEDDVLNSNEIRQDAGGAALLMIRDAFGCVVPPDLAMPFDGASGRLTQVARRA